MTNSNEKSLSAKADHAAPPGGLKGLAAVKAQCDALEEAAPAMAGGFHAMVLATHADKALDGRTRSLIALAVAASLGQEDVMAIHAEEARKAGVSVDEVAAAVSLSVSVKAGVAFTQAAQVLAAYSKGG
ncbi:carboxymuconolactone decarboxylase family protein [Formicincola oecophyllae]|uniref:Carboxymuconolactone decarboxylase family protein n=1 Tax=Formicincola oecophyllae TaxID=2558361 RepID=A0A4Y6UAT7_9PROT|nr:carboxymuconolactone decarboxylase family protein [Formicincola oecophyllae]QDH13501.1 carboxymuconolactone decarboxylase family protein [Formicincola oecophyllae]